MLVAEDTSRQTSGVGKLAASDRYYSCPDLQMLAGAYGLKYLAITNEAHLTQAAEALAEDMPYLMDVRISPNSVLFNIYHDTKILEENRLGD